MITIGGNRVRLCDGFTRRDVLRIGGTGNAPASLPEALVPRYANEWEIGVLYGPHGAPDFFAPEDVEMFFSTAWKVVG